MERIIAIIVMAFMAINANAQYKAPVVFSKDESDTIKCSLDGVNWFWVEPDVLYSIRYVSNRKGVLLDRSKFELITKKNLSFRVYLNPNGQKRIKCY